MVANEDRAVFDFQDTRIGDGHSEDVGGKVFEGCFAGADGLGVDVPVDLPDIGRDLMWLGSDQGDYMILQIYVKKKELFSRLELHFRL